MPCTAFSTLLHGRHEEEQTSEQQPFATATRASQESAGSHNDEAQAASLLRQQAAPAANVPSHEQAEYGLRSHLEAFEAGSTAAPVLSSQLSQVGFYPACLQGLSVGDFLAENALHEAHWCD